MMENISLAELPTKQKEWKEKLQMLRENSSASGKVSKL
jgi:hypothetical protein